MKFINHYSSSRGNLYEVVADNGKRLLLECGVRWQQLQSAIKFNLEGIEGGFVTHGHKDHSKAMREVLNAGIDIYASTQTFDCLGQNFCLHEVKYSTNKIKAITNNTLVRTDSFEVFAFSVEHDCEGSFGFIVREKATGEYLLFAVDTCNITQRFPYPFSIIAIECAYDISVLKPRLDAGEVNEVYAKRLLTSHMEKQNCIKYLKGFCDKSKLREIHLLHLSGGNIDRRQTQKEIEDMFFISTHAVSRRSKDADNTNGIK